jgi:hypothetical protein
MSGGLQVQGQPGLHSVPLSQNRKEKKKKIDFLSLTNQGRLLFNTNDHCSYLGLYFFENGDPWKLFFHKYPFVAYVS